MKTLIVIVAMLGAGFGAGMWYARRAPAATSSSERKVLYWVDPMHPSYKSDKPGIAPDCGMKLEPVYADGGQQKPADEKPVLYYHDPQQPSYRSDKPGINPETGNDLVPVTALTVSVERQQAIGVRYATVEGASGSQTIRANGRVAQDETRLTRVHPKIEGWIHKVEADFTGQFVKAGAPLISIYSPEMLASQQEFLLALSARDSMKSSPSREAYENSELLVEAARRRLELWDLGAAQVAELERTRKPVRTVTLYSPASGHVVTRNAFASQRVTPETELYVIADLSRVWIMADVFESDMQKVRIGQMASIDMGSQKLAARVTYLQPQIDPTTRTLKVRLEAANPNLALKPEQFVAVEFQGTASGAMTVPNDAVVNTGLRKTVYVDHGGGELEPRAVETGARIGDRIEIVSGLKAGERVVAAGAFLIDSEAQLKSGGAHD